MITENPVLSSFAKIQPGQSKLDGKDLHRQAVVIVIFAGVELTEVSSTRHVHEIVLLDQHYMLQRVN
jgi:hypothetical protein